MKFPTWTEFTDKLSNFEGSVKQQIGKKVNGFQDKHPLMDKGFQMAIKLLPSPIDVIADTIYNTSSGSEEDKINHVLDTLNSIKKQGQENFAKLSTEISLRFEKTDVALEDILSTGSKEKTLLSIKDLLLDSNQHDAKKLDELGKNLEAIKKIVEDLDKNFQSSFNRASDLGLSLLGKDYFKENKNIESNFEDWLNGYVFNLSSIFYGKEYRRESIIQDIKKHLDRNNICLLLGEMGVSKSTLLMEIACDYFKEGYTVLLNEDNLKQTKPEDIAEFIRQLIREGKNVLVAIEGMHNMQLGLIYYVIKLLEPFERRHKIKFIMTARQPDLDTLVVSQKKFELPDHYRQALDSFFRKDNSYHLRNFTYDEVKEFIIRYRKYFDFRGKSLDDITTQIFSEAKGHPTLVRFYITGNGIRTDVEDRYSRYLCQEDNHVPDYQRIETVIVCSLLHFSSVPCTNDFLRTIKLVEQANNLKRKVLFNDGEIWNTLHPVWDLELMSFLSSITETKIELPKILSKSIAHIINQMSDDTILSILNAIINPIIRQFFSIEALKDVINQSSSLDKNLRSRIYGLIIGPNHYDYGEHTKAIDCFEQAMKLNEINDTIYYNAALAYHQHGVKLLNRNEIKESGENFLRAIELYDKAFSINPKNAIALSNKANTLFFLRRPNDAKNAANVAANLAPEDDIIWYNKGMAHFNLQEWQDAINAFDNTTSINENYIHAWFFKAVCYSKIGNQDKSSECLDKVIELDPNFPPLQIFHFLVHHTINKGEDSPIKMFLQDPTEPTFSKYYDPRS